MVFRVRHGMSRHFHNFLSGVSSLLAIFPAPHIRRHIPKGNDNQRLHEDLMRVGRDMNRSLSQLKPERRT